MTFEDLFEKMKMNKKDHIVDNVRERLHDMKRGFQRLDNYTFLNGFIYGLYGAGFITVNDYSKLHDILIEIC